VYASVGAGVADIGIHLVDVAEFSISQVTIYGFSAAGIMLDGTPSSGGSMCGTIDKCFITGNPGSGIRTQNTEHMNQITVIGNRIQGNQRYAIEITERANTWHISGNDIEGNYLGGIYAPSLRSFAILCNYYEPYSGSPNSPILMEGEAGDVIEAGIIAGNMLSNGGYSIDYGIKLVDGGALRGVEIAGNWLGNYDTAAIMSTSGTLKDLNIHDNYYGTSAAGVALHETGGFKTLYVNNTTPSVDGWNLFKTANTGATTISMLDDGVAGQRIIIIFGDSLTTIDFTGTNLKGNGGVDWSPSEGDWMECVFDGSNWYCSCHDCTA